MLVRPASRLWRNDARGRDRPLWSRSCPTRCSCKPANLGSSIGVSRANDREGLLRRAVDLAFTYDRRVLIEKGARASHGGQLLRAGL